MGSSAALLGSMCVKSGATDSAVMAIHQRRHTAVHWRPKNGSAASRYQLWNRWLTSVITATTRTPVPSAMRPSSRGSRSMKCIRRTPMTRATSRITNDTANQVDPFVARSASRASRTGVSGLGIAPPRSTWTTWPITSAIEPPGFMLASV